MLRLNIACNVVAENGRIYLPVQVYLPAQVPDLLNSVFDQVQLQNSFATPDFEILETHLSDSKVQMFTLIISQPHIEVWHREFGVFLSLDWTFEEAMHQLRTLLDSYGPYTVHNPQEFMNEFLRLQAELV